MGNIYDQQRGSASLGFLLAAIPLVMLALGGVELAHWLSLRQVLSMALINSARVGVTHQAQPMAIAASFEHNLHMLWPQAQNIQQQLRRRQTRLGLPWQIRILQPQPAAFADFADSSLKGPPDRPRLAVINNNYQSLQHRKNLSRGWPDGNGPRSAQDIFQANTLSLELLWPEKPLLPITTVLLKTLAGTVKDQLSANWMQAGYLPFKRYASMAMQSHPAQWPGLADGRVVYASSSWPSRAATQNSPPTSTAPANAGETAPDNTGNNNPTATNADGLSEETAFIDDQSATNGSAAASATEQAQADDAADATDALCTAP